MNGVPILLVKEFIPETGHFVLKGFAVQETGLIELFNQGFYIGHINKTAALSLHHYCLDITEVMSPVKELQERENLHIYGDPLVGELIRVMKGNHLTALDEGCHRLYV